MAGRLTVSARPATLVSSRRYGGETTTAALAVLARLCMQLNSEWFSEWGHSFCEQRSLASTDLRSLVFALGNGVAVQSQIAQSVTLLWPGAADPVRQRVGAFGRPRAG